MALPKDYEDSNCSLSRSLEVVGERWTLLIVRDAFFGVRRFGDFVGHLGIPRAVLADRLKGLVDRGVMIRTMAERRGRAEYELTSTGLELWPTVYNLILWGDDHFTDGPIPRWFRHAADGGRLGRDSICEKCYARVDPGDVETVPGPGVTRRTDAISAKLKFPHRLLEPLTST